MYTLQINYFDSFLAILNSSSNLIFVSSSVSLIGSSNLWSGFISLKKANKKVNISTSLFKLFSEFPYFSKWFFLSPNSSFSFIVFFVEVTSLAFLSRASLWVDSCFNLLPSSSPSPSFLPVSSFPLLLLYCCFSCSSFSSFLLSRDKSPWEKWNWRKAWAGKAELRKRKENPI